MKAATEGVFKDVPTVMRQTVSPLWGDFLLEYVSPRYYDVKPPRLPSGNTAVTGFNPDQLYNAVLRQSTVLEHPWDKIALLLDGDPFQLAAFDKIMTDAVIFDLDGTLLDSLWAWEHSGSNYLRSKGINPSPELDKQLEQLSLQDGAVLIKKMYDLPYTVDEIIEETLRPVREHYYTDIPAKSKVPELLKLLKERGIKMAVATGSDGQLTRAVLTRLGLIDYFSVIITCDEVGVGKLSPVIYETTLTRLGTQKSRTVVVEDAPYAVETARTAQFYTIGVFDPKHRRQLSKIKKFSHKFVSFE